MSRDNADLDYLDDEIEREEAIFRGEPRRTPARRPSPNLGIAELLLGGAAVGILIVAVVAALEDAARARQRRRRGSGPGGGAQA